MSPPGPIRAGGSDGPSRRSDVPVAPEDGHSTEAPTEGAVRPNVVVSRCLGFEAVRYNGRILKSRFVEALRDHVRFLQVCPEVEIGLGVPRDPIRVEADSDEVRLVQPSTDRDLTREMTEFAAAYLEGLRDVDGFILKARSPSCAFRDAKVYDAGSESGATGRGPGLFAAAVTDAFPWAAREDEGRLSDPRLRHHFLTHLWALARLRRVEATGRMASLVRYHASYKFLLMTRGPAVPGRLGRIVANPEDRAFGELVTEYRRVLGDELRGPPRTGDTVNALQHVFGFVSDRLEAAERRHFLELLEEFRGERLTLPAILPVLRSWATRFDETYLESQRLFEPYPRPLQDLSTTGGGRRA